MLQRTLPGKPTPKAVPACRYTLALEFPTRDAYEPPPRSFDALYLALDHIPLSDIAELAGIHRNTMASLVNQWRAAMRRLDHAHCAYLDRLHPNPKRLSPLQRRK